MNISFGGESDPSVASETTPLLDGQKKDESSLSPGLIILAVLAVLVIIVLLSVGIWALYEYVIKDDEVVPAESKEEPRTTTPAPSPSPSPAPSPSPSPAPSPSPSPAPVPAPAPAPVPAPAPTPQPPPTLNPVPWWSTNVISPGETGTFTSIATLIRGRPTTDWMNSQITVAVSANAQQVALTWPGWPATSIATLVSQSPNPVYSGSVNNTPYTLTFLLGSIAYEDRVNGIKVTLGR